MGVHGMNHFTIVSDDLDATRAFYQEVLGFREGYRPPFGFPGIWFYVGEDPILHVIGGRGRPEPGGGVFDHMAFTATDLPATLQTLKSREIRHNLTQQAGTGLWQLFFHDPNGAKIELDFAAHERP